MDSVFGSCESCVFGSCESCVFGTKKDKHNGNKPYEWCYKYETQRPGIRCPRWIETKQKEIK